jgi:MSHA biogenesis protein MshP
MRKGAEAGFALVTAIFLLVVLAALGAFMVTLSGVHQTTPTQALDATRVYYGAKAGLDWGIQQAIAASNCPASPGTTLTLTGSGLNGVTAVVNCTSTAHTGGNVYVITSTAERGTFGGIDYARRRMQATVTNIP